MSWTILINTTGSHFKFWSYNHQTGERHWGRIGSTGQRGNYDSYTNDQKADEKLSRGYETFSRDADYSHPSSAQVRQFLSGSTATQRPRPAPAPARQRTGRTTRRATPSRSSQTPHTTTPTPSAPVRRTRTVTRTGVVGVSVPELNRTHRMPGLTGYKTDTKGFIKNYRSEYKRPTFDDYVSNLKIVDIASIVGRDGRPLNNTYFRLGEAYFKKIPKTSQHNKPDHFGELRDPSRPAYAAVFYEKGSRKECVAIYGIHRRLGYCDFLAIKTTTRYKTSMLKLILSKLTNASNQRELTFKLKSIPMRKAIKEIADYYEGNGATFKYKIVDLRSGVSQGTNEKPKRWID